MKVVSVTRATDRVSELRAPSCDSLRDAISMEVVDVERIVCEVPFTERQAKITEREVRMICDRISSPAAFKSDLVIDTCCLIG